MAKAARGTGWSRACGDPSVGLASRMMSTESSPQGEQRKNLDSLPLRAFVKATMPCPKMHASDRAHIQREREKGVLSLHSGGVYS